MKTRHTALLVLTVSILALQAQTDDDFGFAGIAFGSPKQVVAWSLIRMHRMTPKGLDAAPPFWAIDSQWRDAVKSPVYWSREGMDLYLNESPMVLSNYRLGGHSYDVRFHFNENNRFCGYDLIGKTRPAPGSKRAVKEELVYLTHAFAGTYNSNAMVDIADTFETFIDAQCLVRDDMSYRVTTGTVSRKLLGTPLRKTAVIAAVRQKALAAEARYAQAPEFTLSQLKSMIEANVNKNRTIRIASLAGLL